MVLRTISAALLASALAFPAFADSSGPIRSVTLSSGGLAEIVRKAEVDGGGRIIIEVPLDQVDDILKSLVVRDEDGSVVGMRLAGVSPLDETFRTLPFSAEDLGSLPSLLSSIQGTEVSVTSGGKTVSGRVLGVEVRQNADGLKAPLLTVLGKDGKISTLWLTADAEATVLDETMARKVGEAAAAAGKNKSDGSRAVTIEVGGGGEREVAISYVVAAPVWKTAYRVVTGEDGKARLQAWAVLENATGEDWDDVRIALSSGDPVTLKQRLHQRYWRERPEVPVDVSSGHVPDADIGDLNARRRSAKADEAAMAPPAPMASRLVMAEAMDAAGLPSAEMGFGGMAQAADTGTTSEGDVTATFELAGLHDLASGDTMSVPIVDAEVEAEMVSVYRAQSGLKHPVAAVMLENTTGVSLPAGILTVYDSAEGYVGDSRLVGLPAGDSRMASFASDRKVTVVEETHPDRRIATVRVVDGMIRASVIHRQVTTYSVSGALDAPRTVVIEHPRMDGWEFSSKAAEGETATHHRLKVRLEAGEEREVVAVHELVSDEAYGLAEADPQALVSWSGTAADEETSARLRELADARRAQMAAERDLSRIEREISQVEKEQDRVRKNLAAVPQGSDLHGSYLGMLADQEGRLADLEKRRTEAEEAARSRSDEVDGIIRTF